MISSRVLVYFIAAFHESIERGLQFLTLLFEFVIVRFRSHENRLADDQLHSAERFRNLELIPTFECPKASRFQNERNHRCTGLFGQKHWTGLGHISWAFWAIKRERDGIAGANRTDHIYKTLHASAGRGAFDDTESKPLYASRSIFTIEAGGRKNKYAAAAEAICTAHDSVMPKNEDRVFARRI